MTMVHLDWLHDVQISRIGEIERIVRDQPASSSHGGSIPRLLLRDAQDDADYILETFPIVKRKDEKEYGEYRTKRVILEIYDGLQQAIAAGVPYQTRLDPPPADPTVAHPAHR